MEKSNGKTERQEAAELFQSLAKSSLVGVYIVQDGKFQFVNTKFQQLTGFSRDELLGREALNLVFPDDRSMVREKAVQMLRGERSAPYEYRVINKAREVRWLVETVASVTYRGKRAVLGNDMDITEQKQAEKKAQKLAVEKEGRELAVLREVDRLQREFLANVSHELRGPLTAIKGFATTLLRPDARWSEAQQRDFLETISQETDRLTHLISDLMDISRIEAGTLKLEKANCYLADLLKSLENRLSILTQHHQLQVVVPAELPLLSVDEMRIGQVITNLVENATKFSPPGSLITIDGTLAGDQVTVRVTDRGVGIPPQLMDRIFDRFYQAETIVSGRKKGTGLGLSICRGIIAAHGGKIWVESQEGKGSTFCFSLPVVKGGEASAENTGH